jgi:hypothetical protein
MERGYVADQPHSVPMPKVNLNQRAGMDRRGVQAQKVMVRCRDG